MSAEMYLRFPDKPVVFYDDDRPSYIRVGYRALVVPFDHPDADRVTGDGITPVTTSTVLAYDEGTGEFVTENTVYVPL
jgi:hypothetical protein